MPNGAQVASLPAFEKRSKRLSSFNLSDIEGSDTALQAALHIEGSDTALQAALQAGSLRSISG